ncbi:adenosine deaminase/editase [Syncephalastrum racemosum]|uniref:Adenosine deaminase/editase n=1 Tax=Syncephalastrum racemosum TaxID=13706 RepID=A0A1X2HI40_SYNRA|nr:adenosine deaminase/editase [Syncephalastrum racemosum]
MDAWKKIPDFADLIASESLNQYGRLPKTGKPQTQGTRTEWTILATIVQVYTHNDTVDVKTVSLGTGLKCLAFNKLIYKTGVLVHDNHAEVMARRGFIQYILSQATKESGPFFLNNRGRLGIKPHYSFHMYISQSPCGDASMTSLAEAQTAESYASYHAGTKRKTLTTSDENDTVILQNMYRSKRQKAAGARAFQRGRTGYNQLGILRTKPGRLDSEPSLCMSCSDKLARWNVLGIQSALLMNLLEEPIYLQSVTVGDMYHQASLERALWGRLVSLKDIPAPYKLHRPAVFHTTQTFKASKQYLEQQQQQQRECLKEIAACPSAISWVLGWAKPEIIVHGRRSGASKSKEPTAKMRPTISKAVIFETFLRAYGEICRESRSSLTGPAVSLTYKKWKELPSTYWQAKECLLEQCFSDWLQTPCELEGFSSSFANST